MPVWSVTTLPDSLNIDAIRRGAVNRRAPLHPLDQFWAFMALREKCESDEEVATAFRRWRIRKSDCRAFTSL